jgi:hypothetical protein
MSDGATARSIDERPVPRSIRLAFRGEWGTSGRGLLSSDPRIRTLRKVLVTYPDVRHILPDRISLDGATEQAVLDTVTRFLERQQWLVKSVRVE